MHIFELPRKDNVITIQTLQTVSNYLQSSYGTGPTARKSGISALGAAVGLRAAFTCVLLTAVHASGQRIQDVLEMNHT